MFHNRLGIFLFLKMTGGHQSAHHVLHWHSGSLKACWSFWDEAALFVLVLSLLFQYCAGRAHPACHCALWLWVSLALIASPGVNLGLLTSGVRCQIVKCVITPSTSDNLYLLGHMTLRIRHRIDSLSRKMCMCINILLWSKCHRIQKLPKGHSWITWILQVPSPPPFFWFTSNYWFGFILIEVNIVIENGSLKS